MEAVVSKLKLDTRPVVPVKYCRHPSGPGKKRKMLFGGNLKQGSLKKFL